VDALVAAGYNLLLENPQYQSLVWELNGRRPAPRPLNVELLEQRASSCDLLDL
jgi:hypothetical protein